MEIKTVGGPCGFHGPYTFYKGLQIVFSSGSSNTAGCNNSASSHPSTNQLPNGVVNQHRRSHHHHHHHHHHQQQQQHNSSHNENSGDDDGTYNNYSSPFTSPLPSPTNSCNSDTTANPTTTTPTATEMATATATPIRPSASTPPPPTTTTTTPPSPSAVNNSASTKSKLNPRKCVSDRRTDLNSATGGGGSVDGSSEGGNLSSGCSKPLVLGLGDCIPVRPWSDSPIACLAEIRMIWRDRNEQCLLTALRLYFLPENTPMGRNCHGEDEVVAISDKVIIRAEDFLNWFDEQLQWNWGLARTPSNSGKSKPNNCQHNTASLRNSRLDFNEVDREKNSDSNAYTRIAVLSYPRYCRYRATLKRLESVKDDWFQNSLIAALSGFPPDTTDMRIMFCKDTFDYPELETHEQLCNHLAPKLKGRPRGRKKKSRSESPLSGGKRADSGSESNESEISIFSLGKSSVETHLRPPHLRFNHRPARNKVKSESEYKPYRSVEVKKELDSDDDSEDEYEDDDDYEEDYEESLSVANRKPNDKDKKFLRATCEKKSRPISATLLTEEKFFLRKLHEFHIKQNNDIPKMVWVSLKDVHLYAIFCQVKKLGGYDAVTIKKLWKCLFGEKSGPHNTITRKKYERILLPLERSELVTKKNSRPDIKKDPFDHKPDGLKMVIKKEKKGELELSREDMAKIQNKVKSKTLRTSIDADIKTDPLSLSPCPSDSSSNRSDVALRTANRLKSSGSDKESSSRVSVPVTVIVGGSENSTRCSISPDDDKRRTNYVKTKMNTSTAEVTRSSTNSSSQKIQIQQPHTTITVHQTTIHPQTHSKLSSNQNQIQITNQIQIQQITVQPNGTGSPTNETGAPEFRCNIKQDRDGQEVKIEKRKKGDRKPYEKENIPFIAAGTTITPVLSQMSALKKTPEIIDLVDSDSESGASVTALPSSARSSMPAPSKTISKSGGSAEIVAGSGSIVPPVKKRKLDILREGGLEVTAISNTHGVISTTTGLPPVSLRIPSQTSINPVHRYPDEDKYNLPSATSLSIPRNGQRNNPPKIVARSMYTKTGKVFGNPKDVLPSAPIQNGASEILDLTVKSPLKFPAIEIHTIPSARRTRSPPTINGQANSVINLSNSSKSKIQDSGLQITLVPSSRTPPSTHVQNIHNSQNHNMKRKAVDIVPLHIPQAVPIKQDRKRMTSPASVSIRNSSTPTGRSSSSPAHTNQHQSRSARTESHHQPVQPQQQQHQQQPQQQPHQKSTLPSAQPSAASPTSTSNFPSPKPPSSANFPFPGFLPQLAGTTPNPFLSMLNPVFLSNLYAQTPNIFMPNQLPQELLQLYKNLPPEMGIAPISKN